jgi:hypothetical protein
MKKFDICISGSAPATYCRDEISALTRGDGTEI